MNLTTLSFSKSITYIPTRFPPKPHLRRPQSPTLYPVKSSSSNGSTTTNDGEDSVPAPDTAQIRFKRGSRKRARQKQEDGGVDSVGLPISRTKAAAPKEWESMTLTEKAIELYVGEKGLLFWINKFAYASIYIVIGAWILFRFVGPALNLYQLDTPPLSPSDVLKG
ncbi:hypothetical protein RJ639_004016 [Escallonia herrerae]|uniref:Uncharacterized protein n=1 Tax=Escallonia herrerae TaxID=1293975 RepID=A0AA89AX05_9ASTE|nr:hypothetical protein RJ639_004016 [Escallonia herrerae]